MKKIVIIGAGPAGLTAAFELLKRDAKEYQVTILEETGVIGGISQTVRHGGNRMDIGGHRFFSKDDRVMQWWQDIMPRQGKPSFDDIKLHREKQLAKDGPDPAETDRVMLVRRRVSRIYYKRKFFDYPVTMKPQTIKNMGAAAWVDATAPFLIAAGLTTEEEVAAKHDWFEKLYPLVAERMKRFTEAPEKLAFIFDGPKVTLDEKSVKKNLLKEGCRADEVLAEVRAILADESIEWACDPLQDACRELTEKLDLKAKLVFQPIRVAVTGSQVSPPLFESIELMDRADVVARLDYTINEVFGA